MFDFVELLLTGLTQGKWVIGLGSGTVVGVICTHPLFDSFNFIFVVVTALIGAAMQFSIILFFDKAKDEES